MTVRTVPLWAVCLLLAGACDDKKTEEGGDEAKAEANADDKAEGDEAGKDDGKADDAAGEDGGDAKAEGGEPAADNAMRDCPKTLSGRESADRVIGKACGVVEVTGTYAMDGATLTLEPGATLAFKDGAALDIGYRDAAKLVVQGTKDEPVTFTSAGDKAAGVWKGVRLYPKAARSSIEGLVVEYAGDRDGTVQIQASDVTFKDSTIRHANAPALHVSKDGRLVDFTGNTFEDVGKEAMRVSPLVAGDIEEGNTFPEGARVHVTRDRLHDSTTWKAIGAPMLLMGEVRVEGASGTRVTLEIAAGAEVDFDSDASLLIGYGGQGGLKVAGTADKPVLFTSGEAEEAGRWRGLGVWGKGEAELEHLKLQHGGKREDDGVLYLHDNGRLSASNVSFVDNTVGMVVKGKNSRLEKFDSNVFENTAIAMKIPPRILGALGGENEYKGAPRIIVDRGRVEEEQTWKPQKGSKTELEGELRVDKGTVSIEPGTTFHMKEGSSILVGYADIAALRAEGTADETIQFIGQRDEPGTWQGITFYPKARGSVLSHIEMRNAGEPAALQFKGESDAKIDTVSCAKCEGAVLARDKKAKVEVTGLEATEGTPKTE